MKMIELEPAEVTQLAVVAKENSLPSEKARSLMMMFAPMARDAQALIKQCEGVTDAGIARTCRLKLRDVRIRIENTRKTAKEDSMREGKAVDGMANVLKFIIEPVESRLSDCEKAEEIAAKKRKDEMAVEGGHR